MLLTYWLSTGALAKSYLKHETILDAIGMYGVKISYSGSALEIMPLKTFFSPFSTVWKLIWII